MTRLTMKQLDIRLSKLENLSAEMLFISEETKSNNVRWHQVERKFTTLTEQLTPVLYPVSKTTRLKRYLKRKILKILGE